MTHALITGGAGFVGSHLVEHLLKTTDWRLTILDRVDETSTLARIGETDVYKANRDRCQVIWHDLKAPINAMIAHRIGEVNYVVHLAASTHVDRSITDPMTFVTDNVVGTVNVLDYVRQVARNAVLLYFSTDEVFGPAPGGISFPAWARYKASNPYAASKAAAEEFVVAYANTYRLKTLITHATNIFGERQHPEKFLPLIVKRLLTNEKILVHADPQCVVPSSRYYIHARNVAAAVVHVLQYGEFGEKYNITDDNEVDSRELVQRVAGIVGVPAQFQLVNSVTNRPGHDMRYALNGSALYALGFVMPVDFPSSLEKTVKWYVANKHWLGL